MAPLKSSEEIAGSQNSYLNYKVSVETYAFARILRESRE
jgi:hypothetical protein